MDKLPARTGWLWVKEGFALFRRQPAEISALFLAYMLLMICVGIVPLIGQMLPLILVPVFAMAFMQACVNIEQGRKVYPNLLMTGFRSPALRRLLALGVLYLAAAILAIGASILVDGGVFWKIVSGGRDLDEETIRQANLSLSMLISGVVYLPFAMAFWYAAPLIAWQEMGVGKAVFYSFFAVWRNAGAFVVYGLAWVGLGILFPSILSSLIAIVLGSVFAATIVVLTLSLILTVILYCSFYPTYTRVFGRPKQTAPLQLPQ